MINLIYDFYDFIYAYIYTMGLLNAWFWLVNKHFRVCNLFLITALK